MSGVNGTNVHGHSVQLQQSQINPNAPQIQQNQINTPATNPAQQSNNNASSLAYSQAQNALFQQLTNTTGQQAQQATFPSPQGYNNTYPNLAYDPAQSGDPSLNPINQTSGSSFASLFQQSQNQATVESLMQDSPELQQALRDPSLSPAMKALIQRLFVTVIISHNKLNRDIDAVANLDKKPNETDQSLAQTFLSNDARDQARGTDQATNTLKALAESKQRIAGNIKS